MIVAEQRKTQGLGTARALMVLSGMSPLFVIWAIRGSSYLDDRFFIPACSALVFVPNLFLWLRFRAAKRNAERRELVIEDTQDQRSHLLVYLLAMLLPFYADTLGSWRGIAATTFALGLIVFLFWHLDLHYMNFMFAARGYRVFAIRPESSDPRWHEFVLITTRTVIPRGTRVIALRVTDYVYFEEAR